MHISLDQAIGRQPRLNRVGQSLLNIGSGASAAYSLRSLTGDEPKAVRIRRDGDNEERDFTTAEIVNEAAAWTNGLQETTLPADVATSSAAYSLRKVKSDYTGPAVRIRRTSDDVEVNVSFDTNDKVSTSSPIENTTEQGGESGSTTATTLGAFLTEEVTGYSSNFTTTDGWSGSSTTVTANVDANADGAGVPPSNDFLKLVANDRLSLRNNSVVNDFAKGSGSGDIEVTFDYYAPQDISTFKVIAFTSDGNPTAGANNQIVTGSGTFSATVTLTASQASGLTDFRVGSTDDQAGKTLYIKNLQIKSSSHNAAVHTWYDQSGSSNNATQTTDANQPLIVESGSLHTDGGKPALKFNGTSHTLELSAKATIANTSIFSSFRSNSNTQDSVLFHLAVDASNAVSIGLGGATGTPSSSLGSRLRVGGSNVVHKGDNTFTSTSQSLLSYIASSSAAKMFVDSTEETATVESRNSGANNRIGARGDDAKFFNGDISEVILFDSDQTNNRFKIESNINNHYTIYTAAQNGFVNKWYDQSGNGFNAVADADANEPKIVNSGSLLTDGVKFSSGTALKLSGTGLDIFKNTQHAQVFYAIKINDTGTSTTGFFEARNNASVARFLLRNSDVTAGRISLGGRRLDSDSFSSFQSDSGHSNEKVVLTGFINYSDTDAFIFKNGTQIGSDTSFLTAGATSDTSSSTITIGRATASATAEFDAEELIIFNTDQTSNRTAIETNIANAHGITLS
jgi:hypothetical protein